MQAAREFISDNERLGLVCAICLTPFEESLTVITRSASVEMVAHYSRSKRAANTTFMLAASCSTGTKRQMKSWSIKHCRKRQALLRCVPRCIQECTACKVSANLRYIFRVSLSVKTLKLRRCCLHSSHCVTPLRATSACLHTQILSIKKLK